MGNPTTTPLHENWHDGGFIVSEANGHRSRDKVTILMSGLVLAGTIIGKQTIGSSAVVAAKAGNTGNGTSGAAVLGAGVTVGAYVVTFTTATAFSVTNPAGLPIGDGVTGTNFVGGGLTFKITAGGTAFVAGDGFTVTVGEGSGKWLQSKTTAIDGSQVPAGVLFGSIDATAVDKSATAITRACEVNGFELVWDASFNQNQIAAGVKSLAQQGIIVR